MAGWLWMAAAGPSTAAAGTCDQRCLPPASSCPSLQPSLATCLRAEVPVEEQGSGASSCMHSGRRAACAPRQPATRCQVADCLADPPPPLPPPPGSASSSCTLSTMRSRVPEELRGALGPVEEDGAP